MLEEEEEAGAEKAPAVANVEGGGAAALGKGTDRRARVRLGIYWIQEGKRARQPFPMGRWN